MDFSPGLGCSWPPCRKRECGRIRTRSNNRRGCQWLNRAISNGWFEFNNEHPPRLDWPFTPSFTQSGSVAAEEIKSLSVGILRPCHARMVAGSGTKRWLRYQSKTRINAINAGPLILSRCPSCTNKEPTLIPVLSAWEVGSHIPHKQQRHRARKATSDHSSFGQFQSSSFSFGVMQALAQFWNVPRS
jgi:hypothetical protein